MSLSTAEKTYYGGGLIVGIGLAILFGVLAANSNNNSGAYVAAAIGSGLAAAACLIIMLVKK